MHEIYKINLHMYFFFGGNAHVFREEKNQASERKCIRVQPTIDYWLLYVSLFHEQMILLLYILRKIIISRFIIYFISFVFFLNDIVNNYVILKHGQICLWLFSTNNIRVLRLIKSLLFEL